MPYCTRDFSTTSYMKAILTRGSGRDHEPSASLSHLFDSTITLEGDFSTAAGGVRTDKISRFENREMAPVLFELEMTDPTASRLPYPATCSRLSSSRRTPRCGFGCGGKRSGADERCWFERQFGLAPGMAKRHALPSTVDLETGTLV
jgi:hypothetical protein